jgi:hypothetical protein
VYLLRVGRQRRWSLERDAAQPEDVIEAAEDLRLDEREEGLSVYQVEGEGEALEVALRFALTLRPKIQPMDYVAFPSELASNLGLTVSHVPRRDLDPLLGERHHEIFGLTDEDRRRLAEAILSHPGRLVNRVREKDLPRLGAELCRRDPGLRKYLKGAWAALLDDRGPEHEPATEHDGQ